MVLLWNFLIVSLLFVVTAIDSNHGVAYSEPSVAQSGRSSKVSKSNSASKRKKSSKKVADPETNDESSTLEGSSKKSLFVTALVGMMPSPYLGFGCNIGQIGEADPSGFDVGATYTQAKPETVAIRFIQINSQLRIGLGSLFYGGIGGGLRMSSGSWYVLNTTQDKEYSGGASINALTINTGLGIYKRLGSFLIIGGDLLGVSIPVLKFSARTTRPSEVDVDQQDEKSQKAKFDKATNGVQVSLAMIGIGAYF